MAANKSKSDDLDADKFGSPDTGGEDSNDQTINPEPGDDYIGRITDANLAAGSHGLLEVDGKTLWLNGSTAQDLVAGLLKGNAVRLVVDDEEQSFTNDDGDEVTYHNKELQFMDGDN